MSDAYEWLSGFIREDIYIVPEKDKPKPADEAHEPVDNGLPMPVFRGGNQRNILILLNEKLGKSEEALLVKIMQAAGLGWDDVALIVWAEDPRPDLITTLDSHVVISFGLAQDPWCETTPYEVTAANHLNHLRADKLDLIASDVDKKRKLWTALKSLFGV